MAEKLFTEMQNTNISNFNYALLSGGMIYLSFLCKPGLVAQSVTCPTADRGVASLIPARSHTFVEIDHEIISKVILLLLLIQEGLLSVTGQSMCTKYWLTALSSLPRKKVWLGELTVST